MKYLAACVCIASLCDVAPQTGITRSGVVTRVIDGDTLIISVETQFRVRLLNCWAPESHTDGRLPENERAAAKAKGIASRDSLRELTEGKRVIVQVPLPENGDIGQAITLGRFLGTVWLESDRAQSVNEKQVESGNATSTKVGEP